MSSHERQSGSRARLLALGAVGVAVLGGAASWFLLGGRVGGDSAPAEIEPALTGYAPTAPAAGSMLRYETEYPTIPYTTGKRTDRVAALIERIERGEAKLTHDGGERGYLESLLAALDVDPSSQTLVYSQTSLQSKLIGPKTPRAVYFNDDVYVGYVQDGPIEIASLDPGLGPVFYLLEQNTGRPAFAVELGRCLSCHDSYSLTGGGVPRFIFGSGYTGTTGMLVSHEGWILVSDRTPLKSRWGGWYVTGRHGSQVHLGNMVIKTLDDFDKLEELRVGNVDTLEALVDVKPYLTDTSDIVALLVLQHQADVQNLITRLSYDARTAEERREEPLEATAERLLRMMLFVDAVEYAEPISGLPKFVAQFTRRAVRDAQGRSLRDFDLTRRLFRHPLSYVIYSAAFDALPTDVKGSFYRRLNEVLTGAETSEDFAHLRAEDRNAILEILRDTKPDFVASVAN